MSSVEIEPEVLVRLKSFCKERGLKIKWFVNSKLKQLIGMN